MGFFWLYNSDYFCERYESVDLCKMLSVYLEAVTYSKYYFELEGGSLYVVLVWTPSQMFSYECADCESGKVVDVCPNPTVYERRLDQGALGLHFRKLLREEPRVDKISFPCLMVSYLFSFNESRLAC